MTESTHSAMIITCEHGGNRIPEQYRHLFLSCSELLKSHRGFDPGALVLARGFAKAFEAPLLSATVSRLLVDLNRSISHPRLHSHVIRSLPEPIRQGIVERHYLPYWRAAERMVSQGIAERRQVVHISCHSFTPELNAVVRSADIGLLYNPTRAGEKVLCGRWKAALKLIAPDIQVRRNYPYEGRNDGLTSRLRKQWPPEAYLGIEVEINQKFVTGSGRRWAALQQELARSLQLALANQST
ncbi:MAG: N-formylglutamate amidohydrolase [Porticoccaceae bacterium]|nr:N-formylglutamate amidohydrolase [Porticoccaceae bacterium]